MDDVLKDNWFIFKRNGTLYDSRDYGIVVGEFPPIVIPSKRITIESVPGRDGSLTYTDDCYDSYTKTIECAIEDNENIDLSWLTGRGKLILSNEPTKEYDVILKNNIELSQIAIYYRNFDLKFEVQPFKKSVITNTLIFSDKEFEFRIGGNAPSRPIIYLTGTGTISLTINGNTFKVKNLKSTIMIDSELFIAEENELNAMDRTIGDFPILQPGLNNFIIEGDLLKIKIKYQETFR